MRSVAEFVKAERAWPRGTRIKYAKAMAKKEPDSKEFWNAVLIAYGVNVATGRVLPSTSWTLERSLADVKR